MDRNTALSAIRNTIISISLSIVLYKISMEVKNGYILKFGSIIILLYALSSSLYFNYNIYMANEKDPLLRTHLIHNMIFFIFIGLIILFYFFSV